MEMKQKKEKKNQNQNQNQNGRFKKTEFFKIDKNEIIFFCTFAESPSKFAKGRN